jgi:hypothetical protein
MAFQTNNNQELQTTNELEEIAAKMVRTGLVPTGITIEAAIVIAQKGRELGVPATQSLSEIYVVQGKAMLKAELQLQLAIQRIPGFSYDIIELSDESCTIEFKRIGRLNFRYTYDMAKARKTGDCMKPEYKGGNKTGKNIMKDMWEKRPDTMLFNRCTSNALRFFAPDYKSLTFEVALADPETAKKSLEDLTNITPKNEDEPTPVKAKIVAEEMLDAEVCNENIEDENIQEERPAEEEQAPPVREEGKYYCDVSGVEISKKIYDFSMSRYGRSLSFDEQKKAGGS